jgi:hypothetical protein
LVLGRFKELRGVLRISRLENEFHVDLVGDWISTEVDGRNPTENDGPGEDERRDEGGMRR